MVLPNIRSVSFDRATLLVALLTGVGIVATVLREVLIARTFGTNHEVEHFRLAFALPNALGTSLATVIVGALAPVLARFPDDDDGRSAAIRYSTIACCTLAIGLGIAGAATAPWQVSLMAPGYPSDRQADLVPDFVALWLFFVLVAISFGPRAYLSIRGIAWPMAASNLVLAATMSAGLLLLTLLPTSLHTTGSLALIALIGACALLVLHLAAMPKGGLASTIRRSLALSWRDIAGPARLMLVVLIGHLVSAAPRIIDRAAATELAAGTVAAMDYSFAIITVPGIAFGTVFITAAIPRFAAVSIGGDHSGLRSLVIRAAFMIALAMVVGVLVSSQAGLIVRLIFERGAFDSQATELTTRLLIWHALAVGPMVASLISMQAVLVANLATVFLLIAALRMISKLLAVAWMVPAFGLDGLAASFLVPELVSALAAGMAVWLWHSRRLANLRA